MRRCVIGLALLGLVGCGGDNGALGVSNPQLIVARFSNEAGVWVHVDPVREVLAGSPWVEIVAR